MATLYKTTSEFERATAGDNPVQVGGGIFETASGRRFQLQDTGGYLELDPKAGTPDRYSRLPQLPSVELPAGFGAAETGALPAPAPSLADIEARRIKNLQSQIDLIRQEEERRLGDVREERGRTEARSRYLSWMTGTAGAPDVGTRREEISARSAEQERLVRESAAAKIDAILGQTNELALQEYNQALALSKSEQKAYLDKIAENAKGTIASLAATLAPYGKSISDLKGVDPTSYDNLKKMSGLTDYQLQVLYDSSIPEQYKPKAYESDYVGENGNAWVSRVVYNPVTGKQTESTFDSGVPWNKWSGREKYTSNGMVFMEDGKGGYERVSPLSEEEKATVRLKGAQAGYYEARAAATGAAGGSSSFKEQVAAQGRAAVRGLLDIAMKNPQIFGRTAAAPIPSWLRSDAFRDYEADLEFLKGNIIPAALTAMREASKTGGALGAVSDREGAWLASSLGALSMTQSPQKIIESLKGIDASLRRWQAAVEENEKSLSIAGGSAGGGEFLVETPEGTFSFPTQEAADDFRIEAGL
jgi:hypothetical protein